MQEVDFVDWKTAYGKVITMPERIWLRDTAASIQERFGAPNIVNIGIFRGATMYCLREGATKANLLGIDIKPPDAPIGKNLRAKLIFANSAICHAEFSYPIHLLFIDGDHRYTGVRADIAGWAPKVVSGGIIAFHDYAPTPYHLQLLPELEGVRRAVSEWAQSAGWEVLPVVDSLQAYRRPL